MRALEHAVRRFARLSLTLLACASQAAGQDAIERELRVRAWAIQPARHRAAWSAAAESELWTDRIDALDALTRALHFGSPVEEEWVQELAHSVVAEHPNVQAALLRLFTAGAASRHELDDQLSLEQASLLEMREALLLRKTLLARQSQDPQAFAFLLEAARDDGDEFSRSMARRLLASAGPEFASLQVDWLGQRGGGIDEDALLDSLPELLAAGVAPDLVNGLRAVVRDTQASARQKGLVELLEWRARGEQGEYDPQWLVGAWLAPVSEPTEQGPTLDSRWLRASREGLSAGESTIGASLLELARSEVHSQPERASDLARDAAQALVGFEPWSFIDDTPEEVAAAFLEIALARPADCQPEVVRSWVSEDRGPELRGTVSRWLAERVRSSGDACASDLLAERLQDPDPDVRELAFRALADAPEPRLEVLRASWEQRSTDERLVDLRWLSREHEPTPFREDLLQFAETEERRRPSVFQLLATFEGDAEVAAVLERILRSELDRLAGAPRPGALAEHEWHASSAAVALEQLLGPEAVPALETALERALSPTPGGPEGALGAAELPKKLIAILGRHDSGRANLAHWLKPDTPRRARVEAAIWILRSLVAEEGGARQAVALVARKVLTEEYSHCDSELGVRVLQTLAGVVDEATRKFLAQVALNENEAYERRLAAVDALTRHAAQAELERLLTAHATDIRVAAARSLSTVMPADSLSRLVDMFAARRVAFLLPDPVALQDPESLIAAEFLLGAAKRDALPDSEIPTVLARPRLRARAHLAERFEAGHTARVEFTWSLELGLVHELARAGRSESVFDQDASWIELDGRLLAALSASVLAGAAKDVDRERARASLAVVERLARAAAIALAGEPPSSERTKIEVTLWVRRLSVAQERGDWETYARLARRVLECWERGELSLWALDGALGERDLRAGVDPVARLQAAAEQAAARAALQRGELEAAREHAGQARARLGASRAAARAQQDLEAELQR